MDLTARTVDTRVGRLHVETDGDGPPAVLWHSLFVDSTTWSALRPLLRQDRRLILVDGPGHGRSGWPTQNFTLDDCAGAVGEILDAVGVDEPVDWLGNAWGGHVGLTLAATAPHLMRSVTTVATPVRALSRRERATIVPMVWAYRLVGPVRPLVDGVVRALLSDAFIRSRPDDTALVATAFRAAPRTGMHRAMVSAMLNRRDLDPLLPRITTPTLMVVPNRDRMLPAQQIHTAVTRLPCAAAVEIAGEGHVAPIIAQSAELAELIGTFWRDPKGYVVR